VKYTPGTAKDNESITFRLDATVLARLREEASQKDISVNTLVSQIAKDHVSWHSIAPKAGFISVRKALITKLLERYSDEEIGKNAAIIAKTMTKDLFLLLRHEYNLHTGLDILDTWLKMSGYNYSHIKKQQADDVGVFHSFVVQHDMGTKWSMYLVELFKIVASEFGISDYQFDLTPNTLAFRIWIDDEYKPSSRFAAGESTKRFMTGSRTSGRDSLA
jgi:hypothetical protein